MEPWVDVSHLMLMGCSFTHPVSLEHLYARCCFRPWEHHVEQDAVPALLELTLRRENAVNQEMKNPMTPLMQR